MDEIAKYNIERWEALTKANALFTRPYLSLDESSARQKIDPEGRLGEIRGKHILCLAGGGGQQSVAFALLGAIVTVVDLSEPQLQRDREAAAHYDVNLETHQADMRDLSLLSPKSFDIVWQPYSLNFVPDARVVFGQVARVLKTNGLYYFNCANPFVHGLGEKDWNGEGYTLKNPYHDRAEITYPDPSWAYQSSEPVPPVREYRHTLSDIINGLIDHGFMIRHVSDYTDFYPDPNATPGTWEHFTSIAPPWLTIWTSLTTPSILNVEQP